MQPATEEKKVEVAWSVAQMRAHKALWVISPLDEATMVVPPMLACEGYTTPYNESLFPGALLAMMVTTTT